MLTVSHTAVDYDDAPTVLIFGDDPARIEAAKAAAASAGARVAATLGLDEAAERLERQVALDAVIIELSDDRGAVQDALIERIDAMAADDLGAVISMPDQLIDPVVARISAGDVTLLCDPSVAARAGALGMALAKRRSFLSDRGVEDESERLARLSDEVSRIARTLAEMAEREPRAPSAAQDRSVDYRAEEPPPVTSAEVRRMIRTRRLREQFFDAVLFADPAWDMLLDLMAAGLDGQRVAVSSLCIAAAVPPTTALRWIRTMTEQGLFVRESDPQDARRVFIGLSDRAAAAMAGFFAAAAKLGGAAV